MQKGGTVLTRRTLPRQSRVFGEQFLKGLYVALIMASAAASNLETGELARTSSCIWLANFGQLLNPCSRAMKNCVRARVHRAAGSLVSLSLFQRRSICSASCKRSRGVGELAVPFSRARVSIQCMAH